MTRYSNPLPPNQVPPSQGRPAGSAQRPQHGAHPEPEYPAGWPTPQQAPRPQPGAGYADPIYPQEPQSGAQHDPYAALRPDGYGYAQPQQSPSADPYGLAGYTPPQTSASQHGYTPRPPQQAPAAPVQPSFDPYAPAGDRYGASDGYGAGAQHGGRVSPASFGSHEAPAAPQPHGYGAQSQSPGYGLPPAAPQGAGSPYGSGYDTAPGTPPGLADPYQWGGQGIALDPQDYQGQQQGYSDPSLGGQAQWGNDPYGAPQGGPGNGGDPYAGGYPQPQGSFDQSYAEDDAQYEDEPRRGGWKKVAMLVGCMVVVGGVLTVGYNSIMGSGGGGPTPLVRGAEGPSKVKPSEPGGKQFDHTDSKIMGRLGEGGTSASDPTGVRKVPVVTVGRDGSIQPPGMIVPEEQTRATVAVPGLTVIDGLGPSPNRAVSPGTPQGSPPVQMVTAGGAEQPMVVEPPAKKAKTLAGSGETGAAPTRSAVAADVSPSPPPAKKERVAAADPAPAATGPKPTGAGYVAVLASVPASDSSRMSALTQFADLQQKYGTILSNKTPDIQEANLGEKGTYHRLMVGPPGSRDSANSVCSQLKAEGYSGCWVTAY